VIQTKDLGAIWGNVGCSNLSGPLFIQRCPFCPTSLSLLRCFCPFLDLAFVGVGARVVVGGCVLGRCLCHVWRRRVLLVVVVGVLLLFVVRGRVLGSIRRPQLLWLRPCGARVRPSGRWPQGQPGPRPDPARLSSARASRPWRAQVLRRGGGPPKSTWTYVEG
jgi:hypothetical protein